ncbi:MAG: NrfD/PsrC family molybdoenzyme membrane anchor subunit [Gemmatimonadaceae bacterium]
MPDTFFTEPPDWRWLIVLYFFIGGIAGGSLFLASMLQLFGRPSDRPLVRLGYKVAFVGVILSGILLIVDLDKPMRFWHMLFESETGRPTLKLWSPMSVGAWGVTFFGLFAFLGWLGAQHEEGKIRWPAAAALTRGPLAAIIAVLGGITGFFLAGYTGVLLSVTNRPIWADSNWLGVLFLFSSASTASAFLILLARQRGVTSAASIDWLSRVDKTALILEFATLIVFMVSLGAAARVFLGWWGLLLVLGVLVAGILAPLAIGTGRVRRVRNQLGTMAMLVLFGGFMLRVVVIMASEQIHVASQVVRP